MMKTFRILILVLSFIGISSLAVAQEATPAKGEKVDVSRFSSEDQSIMENLAKVKSNMGYHFNSNAQFGITTGKGIRVGFSVRF